MGKTGVEPGNLGGGIKQRLTNYTREKSLKTQNSYIKEEGGRYQKL